MTGRLGRIIERLGPSRAGVAFLATRLACFALAFGVARMPVPTDVRDFFYPQAVMARSGGAPFVDFGSSYNVGFPHLLGVATHLWDSPLVIILLVILAEAAAFRLFADVVTKAHGPHVRRSLALWLVSPVSLLYVALGGQDEALATLTACALLWLLRRPPALDRRLLRSDLLAGALITVGLACTKLLTALVVPLYLTEPRVRQARALALACGLGAALWWLHWTTGQPVTGGSRELGFLSGGNVWTLRMSLVEGAIAGRWHEYLSAPVMILLAMVHCWRRPWSGAEQPLRLWALTGALFMMCSPKSLGTYALMFLPATLAVASTSRDGIRRFLVHVHMPLLIIQQAAWFMFVDVKVAEGRRPLAAGDPEWLLPADVALLAGHLLVVARCLGPGLDRSEAEPSAQAPPEPPFQRQAITPKNTAKAASPSP